VAHQDEFSHRWLGFVTWCYFWLVMICFDHYRRFEGRDEVPIIHAGWDEGHKQGEMGIIAGCLKKGHSLKRQRKKAKQSSLEKRNFGEE
jgi:hypothetical protein